MGLCDLNHKEGERTQLSDKKALPAKEKLKVFSG